MCESHRKELWNASLPCWVQTFRMNKLKGAADTVIVIADNVVFIYGHLAIFLIGLDNKGEFDPSS